MNKSFKAPAQKGRQSHNENTVIFRCRAKDSVSGVTRATLRRAAEELRMNESALIHQALRDYIGNRLNARMMTGISNLEEFLAEMRQKTVQVPLPKSVFRRSTKGQTSRRRMPRD